MNEMAGARWAGSTTSWREMKTALWDMPLPKPLLGLLVKGPRDFDVQGRGGYLPWEDIQGLPDVRVSVPAEHQQEVGAGGAGQGEDDERLISPSPG